MNILQRKAHKCFRNPVATVDPLCAALFKVTTLDPANVDADKKVFYYQVDSQVFAELINNILTDVEYSKVVLKQNMCTFQDDTTGTKIIDGLCLLKLLFDRINTNVVVGVEVFLQNIEATKIHPYQNDVNAMLMDMEESYSKIIDNKSTCKLICR